MMHGHKSLKCVAYCSHIIINNHSKQVIIGSRHVAAKWGDSLSVRTGLTAAKKCDSNKIPTQLTVSPPL